MRDREWLVEEFRRSLPNSILKLDWAERVELRKRERTGRVHGNYLETGRLSVIQSSMFSEGLRSTAKTLMILETIRGNLARTRSTYRRKHRVDLPPKLALESSGSNLRQCRRSLGKDHLS